ncbi:MAG: putative secreted protein, partial [Paenibacillus sp.]|nr:putative secreted protein [Paenibacillus sp.]
NKQISAAKSLPGKELTAFLRMRADSMKILVQLAKLDIKTKENAYRTAKDGATAKQKKVRAAMADIDPLEAAIKAEKSSAGSIKKRFADNWKAFTPLVKKGDPHALSAALDNLLGDFRLIVAHKQNLYNLETKISEVIEAARNQLPDH